MDIEQILSGYIYAWKNIYQIREHIEEYKKNMIDTGKDIYLEELEAEHDNAKKEADQIRERIILWIKTLPRKRTRNIFKLRYINGIDNKTISRFYNLSPESIRLEIKNGKKLLDPELY